MIARDVPSKVLVKETDVINEKGYVRGRARVTRRSKAIFATRSVHVPYTVTRLYRSGAYQTQEDDEWEGGGGGVRTHRDTAPYVGSAGGVNPIRKKKRNDDGGRIDGHERLNETRPVASGIYHDSWHGRSFGSVSPGSTETFGFKGR